MKKCKICNAECKNESMFCEECGARFEEETAVAQEPVTQESPVINEVVVEKKSNKIKIIGIAAAVVAVILFIGMLTNWFGMVSPVQGLINAVNKTVKAKSMTIEIERKAEYEYEGEVEEYETKGTTRLIIDKDKEEVIWLTEDDESKNLYVDGEAFYYSGDYASIEDMEDFDEEFFDVYNSSVGSKKGVKWKKLIKKAELEDYLDHEEMEAFVKTIYKELLCNKKWLKDSAGYSRSGNVYTFKLDIEEFGEDIIEICDDSEALSRTAKNSVEKYVEQFIESAEENDGEIEFKATVKGGKLSKLEIVVESDDNKQEVTLKFSDINKTKISKKEIQEIQEDTEELIEENTCEECGEVLWWTEENEHGDCEDCNDHGYLYEYEGDYYCYDCFDYYCYGY